jgi:hypothetical protein
MKIEVNKSFDIEIKGFKCTITYNEAKYLYDELNKEFGYNAENWWENPPLSNEVDSSLNKPDESYIFNTKHRYNIQQTPYVGDVPTYTEPTKFERYSSEYLDYLSSLK